jgi:hypothetical protein
MAKRQARLPEKGRDLSTMDDGISCIAPVKFEISTMI